MSTLSIILEQLLGEFRDKLHSLNTMVLREATFAKAENKIKVAMGMRRAGKTYFIYQHILSLLQQGIDLHSILYINFEDDRLLPLDYTKIAKLIDAFYELYPENHTRKCYLFLDEIQTCENWAIVIRRMHDSKNAEIFLTGSSAKLLSHEIATSLRGRSLSTEIWPYSYYEYSRAKNISINTALFDKKTEDSLKQHFQNYLLDGGFPEVVHYTQDVRLQTLQEYIDVTLYRDIIERHKIKHPRFIKYMILTMLHTYARPFSINKFYNDAKSQGYSIGKDILYEYAKLIEDAYLAFSIELYSASQKKRQSNPKKCYAIDTGLIKAVTLNSDFGKLFENCIFLELKRKKCKIFYYKTLDDYEIDFLVEMSGGEKKLLQVAWNITDEKTQERESRALESAIKELNIPGSIITLDSYLRAPEKLLDFS